MTGDGTTNSTRPYVLDTHVHHWALKRGDYDWLTPALAPIYRDFSADDFITHMAMADIDGIILVQAAPSEAETLYLLGLTGQHPHIRGVVGWTDFSRSDAAWRIGAYANRKPLVGLRPMIQDIADDDWMLRDELSPAFEAVLRHNLTFDALVLPRHLKNLLTLVERYPDLKVVIDHGAKPSIAHGQLSPWRDDMTSFAEKPNVYCKLSGLVTEAGANWREEDLVVYVDTLYDIFGPERLMWGSDWPVLNLASDYMSWWRIAHRLIERRDAGAIPAIFGGNGLRFYGVRRRGE
jgi:L-fuconolactonase